jgi:hypothetical protein
VTPKRHDDRRRRAHVEGSIEKVNACGGGELVTRWRLVKHPPNGRGPWALTNLQTGVRRYFETRVEAEAYVRSRREAV